VPVGSGSNSSQHLDHIDMFMVNPLVARSIHVGPYSSRVHPAGVIPGEVRSRFPEDVSDSGQRSHARPVLGRQFTPDRWRTIAFMNLHRSSRNQYTFLVSNTSPRCWAWEQWSRPCSSPSDCPLVAFIIACPLMMVGMMLMMDGNGMNHGGMNHAGSHDEEKKSDANTHLHS